MMIGHGIQNAVEWKKQGFGTRGRSPGLESLCGCEGGDDNETCIFMTAMDACDSNLYSLIVFGAQIKQKGADTHTLSLSLCARHPHPFGSQSFDYSAQGEDREMMVV